MNLKKLFCVLIAFLMFSCSKEKSSQKNNDNENALYVVHIHGEWCGTCSQIDHIIHEAAEYFKSRDNIEYLEFDQTHHTTLKDSLELARSKGLEDIFENERHTGEVLYIDKETKEILTRFYGVTEKGIYVQAAEDLLNGAEVASIESDMNVSSIGKPDMEDIDEAELFVIDVHHKKCLGCSKVAPVFKKVAEKYEGKDYIEFFSFDLSNRESISSGRKLAQELGIEKIYNENKHTGEVLFVDAKNKVVLDTLILEEDPDVYHKLIKKLKKLV